MSPFLASMRASLFLVGLVFIALALTSGAGSLWAIGIVVAGLVYWFRGRLGDASASFQKRLR